MKTLFTFILKTQALLAIRRQKPFIVAFTGSYGKTSAKDALGIALGELLPKGAIRYAKKSFNNELGIPFTILGFDAPGRSIFAWLRILVMGWFVKVPKVLVLEIGADHKGEIRDWAKALRPHISVITGVSPVHVENYASYDELKAEKASLGTFATHAVLLNGDDDAVLSMGSFDATVKTYGLKSDCDYKMQLGELLLRADHSYKPGAKLTQLSGVLMTEDAEEPIVLQNATGKAALASVLIAFAVIRELQQIEGYAFPRLENRVIAQTLAKTWKPTPGRLNPLPGIKGCVLLDDSYNAAPAAVEHGLYVLSTFPNTGRKIAVLGRMAELGNMSQDLHERMGEWVAASADFLVAVGEEPLYAVETAKAYGMHVDQIKWFKDSKLAGRFLDGFVAPGDIVYVKGSQSARMEFVIKDLMAEPARAKELLVRQERQWISE